MTRISDKGDTVKKDEIKIIYSRKGQKISLN